MIELKCLTCIHLEVCGCRNGGVNLSMISEDCEHYKPISEWIDVNERLPEENTRVLVALSQEIEMTYTNIDTDRIVDNRWVRWGSRITHWMPLPEPPKVGDV